MSYIAFNFRKIKEKITIILSQLFEQFLQENPVSVLKIEVGKVGKVGGF